jgi:hypothetical protein
LPTVTSSGQEEQQSQPETKAKWPAGPQAKRRILKLQIFYIKVLLYMSSVC